MTKYAESGLQGVAKSTEDGRNQALVHFSLFLASLDEPLPPLNQLTAAQITMSLIQQFGTYLIENARDVRTGDCLMAGTVIQYLSGVKTAIEIKFPKIGIFNTSDWYSALRHDVEKRVKRQFVKLGNILTFL